MKIKLGVVFEFKVETGANIQLSMLKWLIESTVHDVIESKLPEGWLMKIHRVYIQDGSGEAAREIDLTMDRSGP